MSIIRENSDSFLLTDEYKYISNDIKKLGKVEDLESYIAKVTNLYFYENTTNDEIVNIIIDILKYSNQTYRKLNESQRKQIKEYVNRSVIKNVNILNKQMLKYDRFAYYVNNKSERKRETIQHIDEKMIYETMTLVNFAINMYLKTIENKIVVGKFDNNIIRKYKIMKSELPHLLGFDFKRGLLSDENRRDILGRIGLPLNSIEGSVFTKMQKTIELCSNDKFLEYELDRINNGLYPIVDYAAINSKARSFICNNSLENISRIVVLPRGVKPNCITIKNSEQCSMLLSDLKCSTNYDFSSLIHMQSPDNNNYFKSNLTFKTTDRDFNRMIQKQEMSTDDILIIDNNGHGYRVPSNYNIQQIDSVDVKRTENTDINKIVIANFFRNVVTTYADCGKYCYQIDDHNEKFYVLDGRDRSISDEKDEIDKKLIDKCCLLINKYKSDEKLRKKITYLTDDMIEKLISSEMYRYSSALKHNKLEWPNSKFYQIKDEFADITYEERNDGEYVIYDININNKSNDIQNNSNISYNLLSKIHQWDSYYYHGNSDESLIPFGDLSYNPRSYYYYFENSDNKYFWDDINFTEEEKRDSDYCNIIPKQCCILIDKYVSSKVLKNKIKQISNDILSEYTLSCVTEDRIVQNANSIKTFQLDDKNFGKITYIQYSNNEYGIIDIDVNKRKINESRPVIRR